ncbi:MULTISPECIES: hypothetical protein [unclassified Nonomuraea]
MRRQEAVVALALALVMVSAGVTWLFGALGLVAAGAVLLAAVLIMPVKE